MKSRVVLSFLARRVLIVAVSEAMVRLMTARVRMRWFGGRVLLLAAADRWKVWKSWGDWDWCPKGRLE